MKELLKRGIIEESEILRQVFRERNILFQKSLKLEETIVHLLMNGRWYQKGLRSFKH